jgi:hypothetical protein
MEGERVDLADPVVREALFRCRLAARAVMSEEDFQTSPYWLDDEPEATCDGDQIVFTWPGCSLSYRLSGGTVMETVTDRAFLDCRIISRTGSVVKAWRHLLSDPALN